MDSVSLTLRLDSDSHAALSALSQSVQRSVNDLAAEAVSAYVKSNGANGEREWDATWRALRTRETKDTDHERAIERFVDAEARLPDPVEGSLTTSHLTKAQSEIRSLFGET